MIKKIVISLLIVIAVMSIGFIFWASAAAPTMPEAIQVLDQPSGVTVTKGKWITLTPEQNPPAITGYIFYPGARVNYQAYSPALVEIARSGTQVFLTKMPLNMAVFDPNLADEIIQANPQIKNWIIGGHSLGGAMAAQYASTHVADITGLILLGAYPTKSSDLSKSNISILTISGEKDSLATKEDIQNSLQLLPEDATWIEIIGGNHAQMGWYGSQSGDQPATISREEQQKQIIQAVIPFIQKVENTNP